MGKVLEELKKAQQGKDEKRAKINFDEFIPKGQSERTLNKAFSEEEQKSIIEKKSDKTKDIMDYVDYLRRPMYAVTNNVLNIIKTGKFDLDEAIEHAKKGWKGEEKTYGADIIKELESSKKVINLPPEKKSELLKGLDLPSAFGARDPGTLNAIEEKLGWHKGAIDEFVIETLLDPVTYIPIGAPIKLITVPSKLIGKGFTKILEKTPALAEQVAKVSEKYDRFMMKNIYPTFNNAKIWEHEGVKDIFDTLVTLKSRVTTAAEKVGISISKIGERKNIFGGIDRVLMNKENSQLMGEAFFKMENEANEALGYLYAKKLGIGVDDLAKYHELDDLIERAGMEIDGSPAQQKLLKVLEEKIEKANVDMRFFRQKIKEKLNEHKGFKSVSNQIVTTERNLNRKTLEGRLQLEMNYFREYENLLKKQTKKLLKASDDKVIFGLINDEINFAQQGINTLAKDFTNTIQHEAKPEMIELLKTRLNDVKNIIGNMGKYEAKITSSAKKVMGEGRFGGLGNILTALEKDIIGLQEGAITGVSKELQKSLVKNLNGLNKEFGIYKKSLGESFKGLKGNIKVIQEIKNDLRKESIEKLNAIERGKKIVDKYMVIRVAKTGEDLRKVDAIAGLRKKQLYQAFSTLNKGSFHQQTMLEFEATKNAIFEKGLKELPEFLQEPARLARNILDEQGKKLFDADLIRGRPPLYTPRTLAKESEELVSKTLEQYRSTTGFKVGRKFKSYEDYSEYMKKTYGVEAEKDLAKTVMNYYEKSELEYSKHLIKEQLMAKLGKEYFEGNKGLALRESLDYLYRGKILKGNYGVFNLYGKALSATKAGLTVINLAFHGRNILTMPFQMASGMGLKHGLNPMNFADSILLKLGRKGEITSTKGVKYTFDQIRDLSEKSGYFGQSFTRGDIGQSANLLLKRYNSLDPRRWMGEMFNISMNIEDMGRYAALIGALKKGLNPNEAVAMAKKVMFDYNLINSKVDKAMQGIMGFYCVPIDCEILTKKGWKKYNEINIGDDIVSYNYITDILENDKINDIAVFDYDGELMHVKNSRIHFPFTPNHRWPTLGENKKKKIVKGYNLRSTHRLIIVAQKYNGPRQSELTCNNAALLGWILTDGTYQFVGNSLSCAIYQSPKKYVNEIRKLIPGSTESIHLDTGVIRFRVKVEHSNSIKKYLKDHNKLIELLFKLDKKALEAMYNAMYMADGNTALRKDGRKPQQYFAGIKPIVRDVFQILCILLGKAAHLNSKGMYIKDNRLIKVNGILGTEWYKGKVWCPQTNNETWLMRRNGKIIITGNTFSRRNLPRQIAGLINDPAQYATITRVIEKISNRQDLSNEELASLQPYEKESFKIFGQAINGIREFTRLGFFPQEEAMTTMNDLVLNGYSFPERMRKVFGGRINPLLGGFLDFFYSKDSFTGKEYGHTLPAKYTTLIEKASKAIGVQPEKIYKLLELNPIEQDKWRGGEVVGKEIVLRGEIDRIAQIQNVPVLERFIGDMANLVQKTKEGKAGQGVLKYVTGISKGELDIKGRLKQRRRRELEMLMEAGEEGKTGKSGKEIKTIKIPYVPKRKSKEELELEERMRKRKKQ